jgi:hypothetical protein
LRYPHAVLRFGDSFMQIAKVLNLHGRALHVLQTRITALLYPFPIIVLSANIMTSCQRAAALDTAPLLPEPRLYCRLPCLSPSEWRFIVEWWALVVFITGWLLRTSQRVRCLSLLSCLPAGAYRSGADHTVGYYLIPLLCTAILPVH